MSGSERPAEPATGKFEYHFLCLDTVDGVAAAEQKLNAWAAEGWRLLPMTVIGGHFGILERERRA